MADSFKKVQAGQSLEISATVWNALIDVTQRAKLSQHDRNDSSQPASRQANHALVRNLTGFDLARFAVIELGTPMITPSDNELEFKNRTSFSGLLPSAFTGARFGVTLAPIASGAIGTAAVAGIVPVRLAVGTLPYACAAPIPGMGILQSVPHGPATVLWMESMGSPRWAIIRFDPSNFEEIVYITSNSPDEDGFYPANVQRYDTVSRTWITQYACKVIDANR
jgi:hypothetical protein